MVSVFLRTYVWEVHLVGSRFIQVDQCTRIAVYIILFRSASEIFHLVHFCRQTETYTDTGYFQFGGSLARCIAAGSESSHQGCFRGFGFGSFHIGRSESEIGFYYARRRDAVCNNVKVAGSQQIVSCQYGIFAVHNDVGVHYIEVFARLFPYLQAFGVTIAIVVVVRCTPEVRLKSEAIFKVFGSTYLIGRNQTGLLIEYEVYF